MVVLRFHNFSISISRSSYLFYYIHWLGVNYWKESDNMEKNWKKKQSNPKWRIYCKRKSAFYVSVLITHHQDLEKMISSVVRSSMDVQCFFYNKFFTLFFQFFSIHLLIYYNRLALTYQLERIFFTFIIFNFYIWPIALYFSIGWDSKVPENSVELIFIPLFRLQSSIVFTSFPMNIIFYFIMAFFIF